MCIRDRSNTLEVWDAASGDELASYTDPSHKDRVNAVAYSPDGTRIVSGSEDRSLKVWEAATRLRRFRHRQPVAGLRGHTGKVSAVPYSPDGTRIVSGSDDATLKVWDAASGAELATLTGHTEAVTAVAYSPDGARIV